MEVRTEVETETFRSSIPANEDPGNEAAGLEQPIKPPVEENTALQPEKPIKNLDAVGPETPAKTPTEGHASPGQRVNAGQVGGGQRRNRGSGWAPPRRQ
jgi:hypothetical protein